jgi:hypothetical protein
MQARCRPLQGYPHALPAAAAIHPAFAPIYFTGASKTGQSRCRRLYLCTEVRIGNPAIQRLQIFLIDAEIDFQVIDFKGIIFCFSLEHFVETRASRGLPAVKGVVIHKVIHRFCG